jgi:hypothetical protein
MEYISVWINVDYIVGPEVECLFVETPYSSVHFICIYLHSSISKNARLAVLTDYYTYCELPTKFRVLQPDD